MAMPWDGRNNHESATSGTARFINGRVSPLELPTPPPPCASPADVEGIAVAMYCDGERRASHFVCFNYLSTDGGLPLVRHVLAHSLVPVAIFMCSQALKKSLKALTSPPVSEDSRPYEEKLSHLKTFLEDVIVQRYHQGLAPYCLRSLIDCFCLVVRAGLLFVPSFPDVAFQIMQSFGMVTPSMVRQREMMNADNVGSSSSPLASRPSESKRAGEDEGSGSLQDAAATVSTSAPSVVVQPLSPVVPNKLAILLLDALVQVVGHVNDQLPLSEHRRVTSTFKERCMDDVFRVAIACIYTLYLEVVQGSKATSIAEDQSLVEAMVSLTRSVLCFDYLGLIGADGGDVTEEPASMNYPVSWRDICLNPQTFPMLWELVTTPSVFASTAVHEGLLRCVNCLCCIRRSFFQNDEERRCWLGVILQGTIHVLGKPASLQHPRICAEFCRLLCRIKPNYQLNELLEDSRYEQWLAMVVDLTCSAFESWSCTAPCIGYLCSFWARLVGSQQYARKERRTYFDEAVPRIVGAFLQSRVDMAQWFFPSSTARPSGTRSPQQKGGGEFGHDNPLDDPSDEYLSQVDNLALLLRFSLKLVVGDVAKLFRDNASSYASSCVADPGSSSCSLPDGMVMETLAWLAYLFGSLVRTPGADEDFDSDASIISSMFQLMELMMQFYRMAQGGGSWVFGSGSPAEHLELGTLHFLHCFRSVYVGEPTSQANRTLARLQERLGFDVLKSTDMQGRLLAFMVTKIVSNLQVWSLSLSTTQGGGGNGLGGEDGDGGSRTNVLGETLRLLKDLSCGFASGRQLLDLPMVRRLLSPAGARDFWFQETAKLYRLRVRYRHTTTTLLFLESGIHQQQLMEYVSPFVGVLDELKRRCEASASPAHSTTPNVSMPLPATISAMTMLLEDPEIRDAVVGALCDLRGTATACIGRRNFHMFFDAIFPRHFDTLLAVAAVAGDPAGKGDRHNLEVQLLRFAFEVSHNRCQRIHFDSHSAGGFHLFFFVSGVVRLVGERKMERLLHLLHQFSDASTNSAIDLSEMSLFLSSLLNSASSTSVLSRGGNGSLSPSGGDVYSWLLKGTQLLFSIANCALAGAYCNFSVLALYGDDRLDRMLSTVWRFLRLFPLDVLVGVPKLAKEYFMLAAELFAMHMTFLARSCDDDVGAVLSVLSVLEGGLQAVALPSAAATAAYSAIGSLAKHLVEGRCSSHAHPNTSGASVFIEEVIRRDPTLLLRWAALSFKNLLCDDGSSLFRYADALLPIMWCLRNAPPAQREGGGERSAPPAMLLAQMLALGTSSSARRSNHHSSASNTADSVVAVSAVSQWIQLLDKLWDGVEEALDRKARDKFLQNLTVLRSAAKSYSL